MKLARAVDAVERSGILLVYPLANRSDPPSLWSKLYPRSEMRWSWDDGADRRVVELWHLRGALAESRRVVYGKWFQGRATLFSREVFASLLARLRRPGDLRAGLAPESMRLLTALKEESPQGTKSLREATGLTGRACEPAYAKALRALWSRGLIVGAGEVEEGGFPSLAVGATELLFEDLWESSETATEDDDARVEAAFSASPSFRRALTKVERDIETQRSRGVREVALPEVEQVAYHDIWGPRRR